MQPTPLVLDHSIREISIPHQFFAFSHAYLNAAESLCESMIGDESKVTWPNAAVVLMTAAHATELFLKGLILAKVPGAQLSSHNINLLADKFRELYPNEAQSWEVPFETQFLGAQDHDIEDLIRNQTPPSIRYRYPVEKDGRDWNGVSALCAKTFLPMLIELGHTFKRLAKGAA